MQDNGRTRVALVGATGAIGGFVMRRLARQAGVDARAVVRRVPDDAPIGVHAVDFDNDAELATALMCDVLLCALGTTQAKAGKAGLRAVDHTLVLRCLRAARAAGARRAVVVSALGASRSSPSFYSRVKGDMEHDAAAVGFEALHILRPSLLLGPRAESRPAESLGKALAPALNWALPPAWRAVHADTVAEAMVELGLRSQDGVWIHHLPLAGQRSRRIDR